MASNPLFNCSFIPTSLHVQGDNSLVADYRLNLTESPMKDKRPANGSLK